MKQFIEKYHLKYGFLLSVVFPGIFIFQEIVPEKMIIRFVSSFLFIFCLWTVNFIFVDFSANKLKGKRSFWYLRITLAFLITSASYILIGFLVDNTGTMLSQVRGEKFTSIKAWLFLSLRLFLLNCLVLIIKYLFDSSKEKRRVELENEVLKRENLNARHEGLKQQVNPHFLFNSLNTLKSLVKRDPVQAENFINELALVYRYMLLNHDKNMIPIRSEIDFLKSYLYLLEIRFGDSMKTEINIPDLYLENQMPPNTLQLLVENAVKHNAFSLKKPLMISVFLKDDYLIVENNLQEKNEQNASSNMGLSNISNRYLLLKNKDILIKKNNRVFQVMLPIN